MATSAEIRTTLVARLKGKAGISDQEEVISSLPDFMDEALMEHDPLYAPAGVANYTLLPLSEYELVLILAWIRVCEFRASNAAPQPSLRGIAGQGVGSGFGGDRDTPFKKNMDMAKYLRTKYDDLKAQLEADEDEQGSGDITIGELYRKDEVLDIAVPMGSVPQLNAPALTVGDIVGEAAGAANLGSVVLLWNGVLSTYFSEFVVFRSSAANIKQMWNKDGVDGVPFINPGSTKVYTTTDNMTQGMKEQNLAAGTYYYVLLLRDSSNMWSFSNEVSVVIPA